LFIDDGNSLGVLVSFSADQGIWINYCISSHARRKP